MDWSDTYSQESSSGAYTSMSEDTGEELNGRFTAVQNALEVISETIQKRYEETDGTAANVAAISGIMSDLLDLQQQACEHLTNIEKNTFQLYDTNRILKKIQNGTDKL